MAGFEQKLEILRPALLLAFVATAALATPAHGQIITQAMAQRVADEAASGAPVKLNVKSSVDLAPSCVAGDVCPIHVTLENTSNTVLYSPVLSAVHLGLPGGKSALTKTTGWSCGFTDPSLTCAGTGVVLQPGEKARFTVDWTVPDVKARTNARVCANMVWPARSRDGVYRAEQIAAVQYALKRAGFDPGGIDGRVRPKTLDAIQKLRQVAGIAGSAEITPDLLKNLFNGNGALAADANPADDKACGQLDIVMPEPKPEKAEPKIAAAAPAVVKPAPLIPEEKELPKAAEKEKVQVQVTPAPAPSTPVVNSEMNVEHLNVPVVAPPQAPTKMAEVAKPVPLDAPPRKEELMAALPSKFRPALKVKDRLAASNITPRSVTTVISTVATEENERVAKAARLASQAPLNTSEIRDGVKMVPVKTKVALAKRSSSDADEAYYRYHAQQDQDPPLVKTVSYQADQEVACECEKSRQTKLRRGVPRFSGKLQGLPKGGEIVAGFPDALVGGRKRAQF